MSSSTQDYYYAGGRKISLARDVKRRAVDRKDCSGKGLLAKLGGPKTQSLRQGIYLVDSDLLQDGSSDEAACASFPVFSADGATIVVLPDVRVEDPSEDRLAAVREWVEKHSGLVEITGEGEGQITLRLADGKGDQTLAMANEMVEELGVQTAQPRFLRVTDGPAA